MSDENITMTDENITITKDERFMDRDMKAFLELENRPKNYGEGNWGIKVEVTKDPNFDNLAKEFFELK